MTEYNGQPKYWTEILFILKIIFVTVYIIEALLKLIAYGLRGYFGDWWNVFDFVIVVGICIGKAI